MVALRDVPCTQCTSTAGAEPARVAPCTDAPCLLRHGAHLTSATNSAADAKCWAIGLGSYLKEGMGMGMGIACHADRS